MSDLREIPPVEERIGHILKLKPIQQSFLLKAIDACGYDLTERSADTVRVPRELVLRAVGAFRAEAQGYRNHQFDDQAGLSDADADALAAILAGKGEG